MKMNKWVFLGIIAALFNPVPTGLIAGVVLYTEKKYKTESILVLVLSVALFVLTIYVALYPPF